MRWPRACITRACTVSRVVSRVQRSVGPQSRRPSSSGSSHDPFWERRVPPLGQTERARSIYLAMCRLERIRPRGQSVAAPSSKISSLSSRKSGQLLLASILPFRNESTAINFLTLTADRLFPDLLCGGSRKSVDFSSLTHF